MRISKNYRNDISIEDVMPLHEMGLTNVDIGKRLGCTVAVVSHRLKMAGRRSLYGEKDLDLIELKRLHDLGFTNRNLAKRMGVSRPVIELRMRTLGLKANGHSRGVRIVEGDQAKCSRCDEWSAADSFPKGRNGKADWYYETICWKCRRKKDNQRVNSSVDVYLRDRINRLRLKSRRQGLDFDLTAEYLSALYALQGGRCALTDTELVCRFGDGRTNRNACSIDKIVPSSGYCKGNVALVTQRANTIKSDQSLSEMSVWMPEWHARLVVFVDRVRELETVDEANLAA